MLEVKRNGLIRNRLKELNFKGDFPAIAVALTKTTSLERFAAVIEKKDLLLLGHSVHHHPSLKVLSVTGNGKFPNFSTSENDSIGRIQNHKVQFITDFLDLILSGSSLTDLHLDKLIYPEYHLEVIGKYLSLPGSTLKELFLDEFLMYDDYYKFFKLAKHLFHNTSLKNLIISQSEAFFEHSDLAVFAELFKVNKTITTFHLDIRRMGTDEDYKKTAKLYLRLTEAIRSSQITELHLSGYGNLGGHEREILFSENLRRLTLFKVIAKASVNRKVHLRNYRSLANLIIKSQNLTHLTLHVSDIDVKSVRMLAEALSKNTSLKSLYLDFYDHQQDLAAIIVEGIANNTTLTKINLFDESEVPDDNASVKLAQSIITRNRTLQTSLFKQLYDVASTVKDNEFDENGNFTQRSPKRQRQ